MPCATKSRRWRIASPASFRPRPATPPSRSRRAILYVGGRPNQIPQLKALVERTGARFLASRRRDRAQLVASPRPHQSGRCPAVPDRLHQP